MKIYKDVNLKQEASNWYYQNECALDSYFLALEYTMYPTTEYKQALQRICSAKQAYLDYFKISSSKNTLMPYRKDCTKDSWHEACYARFAVQQDFILSSQCSYYQQNCRDDKIYLHLMYLVNVQTSIRVLI